MAEKGIKAVRKKITDYQANPRNHNLGNERGSDMIEKSIRKYGVGRPTLADKNSVMIGGNQTLQAALDAGIEDVIEIETDGKTLIVHKRSDLNLATDKKAVELGYMDNRAAEVSFTLDTVQMSEDIQAGVDFSDMYTVDELIRIVQVSTDDEGDDDEETEPPPRTIPAALFSSDNEWGIPSLDINFQSEALEIPVTRWGKVKRKSAMRGTYHFYEDDYKFEALWSDPSDIINSHCAAVIEPNFSTNPNMARILALYDIYRKRFLARWWQTYGIRIIVDLNVEREFFDLNLLGVPKGWKSYANRGTQGDVSHLQEAYSLACDHAGTDSITYIVYGGGKSVAAHCRQSNWTYIKEDAHETEGRVY